MKNFVQKHWALLLSEGLLITLFCIFYGHYGDIMVDSFREVYIPKQMLAGKHLYNSIFCIYPPLGYIINAALFKIFGINLSVIYFAGLFTTIGIVYFVYQIAKNFFSNLLCLAITLFIIAGFVLSPNVFNPFLPYSSGMLYGLLLTLGAIYYGLNKRFTLTYLLCGLSCCAKFELIMLLPALLYLSGKKNLIKNIISFITPILLVTGILFANGIKLIDIITSINLVQLIGQTKTLNNFYFSMGLIPNIAHIPLYLINFIKFVIPINWNLYQEILIWVFPFIFGVFIYRYKNLNNSERFFVIASLLVSIKVFCALTMQSYGVFFIPFALISMGILLKDSFRKIFILLLIIWSVIIGFYNANVLISKNYEIKSSAGIIKVTPNTGKIFKEIIEYVDTLPYDSTVAVYPECLGINFLTGKNGDDKFYSLIPLYVETFGEEIIIKRLKKYPPDYIILSNYNTFAYGFSAFGKDYGVNIMKFIETSYRKSKDVQDKSFLIYSKK